MNKTTATAGIAFALVAAVFAFTSGSIIAGTFAVLAGALMGNAVIGGGDRK